MSRGNSPSVWFLLEGQLHDDMGKRHFFVGVLSIRNWIKQGELRRIWGPRQPVDRGSEIGVIEPRYLLFGTSYGVHVSIVGVRLPGHLLSVASIFPGKNGGKIEVE